ncbi:MAG TPA: helix-turn-helix domain-containing protein [Actinopolymorphaceae bacterium]|jgi:AraC-like DNA-binding protein/quercetin dioxygenase-like cupin family protein|nr:helix-turn-helix domain-containing protein [Actinopolymorphaceae bacterium]
MSFVFRAEDEPPAARVDYVRQMMGSAFVPLDIRHGVPAAEIRDQATVRPAGAVTVSAVTLSPGGAARTPKLIRRFDPDFCKVDVVESGELTVEQEGREITLGPGDLAFVDFSRPCRWANAGPIRGVAVMFPRALLPVRRGDLAKLTGVRIAGDRGAGGLASALVRQLPHHLDESRTAERVRLGTTVLDLLSVALTTRLDRATDLPSDTTQRAMVVRVHAFIERRLGDTDLAPAAIAAAHHVSLRYLHKLFETEQTTLSRWIQQRRLERCRRDLLDPALSSRPASAISARWGFTNSAHFSRVFRAAYGLPPGEYRLAATRSPAHES